MHQTPPARHRRFAWLFSRLLLLACLLITGCEDLGQGPGSDSTDAPTGDAKPTIVSLTPAITQMLIDMGKRDHLVGVSKEDGTSLGLAVCGSYNNPVIARIVEMEPDLVLTESSRDDASDVPPLLRSLAAEGVFELRVIPHSRSIADVERALTDAELGLGQAVGDPDAGQRARKFMALRFELVQSVLQDVKRPRVLMLINPTTLGAIGTGVTHDELLRLAGGVNALADYNTGYLKLTRAQLIRDVRPDVILIFEPGGAPISDQDARLTAIKDLPIPAVRNNRIVVIRHRSGMLPSTSLPAVMAEMAKAIHPDRAEVIDEAYATAERALDKWAEQAGGDR